MFSTRTIRGRKELPSNSYLYAKRLIIRETAADDSGRHIVHCCHRHYSWGPYAAGYTTTSTFLSHIRTRHARIPSRESDYKSAISQLLVPVCSTSPRGIEISPFTLAKGESGSRAPGQQFNSQQYRKLMAVMVIETNSSFKLVESNAFRTLLAYCNRNATAISRRTVKRDIQTILYEELFKNLKVRLRAHILTRGRINLTIDAWTSSNKLPFLAITAHWIDITYKRFNTLIGFE